MAKSLPGSPIVGFYNEATDDFEEHNRRIDIAGGKLKFEDTTRPYGFVDLNAKMWFQDYLDDGVVHTYLVTEGWLWTGQYPEAKRVITNGNNQSMELDENSLDGTWTIDDKSGMEFFIINEAIFSKLCILGEEFEPCFEGSTITHFSLDDEFNQKIYSLMKEVKKLKGGNSLMENENILENEVVEEEVKEPVTEFAAADEATPEVVEEEPVVEENETDEDKTVLFTLEDFQNLQNSYNELQSQYDELKNQYSALETSYNDADAAHTALQADYDNMKTEYAALVEFKNEKEKEAKQAMIDQFCMLSDEEKKDVQDNIDKYSIDEIESKLSVICVRNKLDMSEKQEEVPAAETTFSLNSLEQEEEVNTPALISLLRKAKKNED